MYDEFKFEIKKISVNAMVFFIVCGFLVIDWLLINFK